MTLRVHKLPSPKQNSVSHLQAPENGHPGLHIVPSAISLRKVVRRGFRDRLTFTAIWLPVGALGVYAKATVLSEQQWRIIGHAFHRAGNSPTAEHFTLLQRTALFSSDCMLGFAVVPFALALLLTIFPRRLWSVTVSLISILVSLIIFLQVQSFKNVGHFIPWYLISDGIHWASQHPEYIVSYGAGRVLFKWISFIGTIVILAVFLHISDRSTVKKQHLAKVLLGTVAAFAVTGSLLGAALGAGGMTGKLTHTWYGRPAIPVMLSATFIGSEDIGTGGIPKSPGVLRAESIRSWL